METMHSQQDTESALNSRVSPGETVFHPDAK